MDSGGWKDETYRVAARSLDGNDRTHRITLSGVYDLPVGRGRSLLGNTNRIVDGAIGWWELGSLYVYETGWPWAIPDNPNPSHIHSAQVSRHVETSTGYIRGVAPCIQQWKQSDDVWSMQQLPFNYSGSCSQADFSVGPEYGQLANTVNTGIRVPGDHSVWR
jgi:hypothetical protein